MISLSRLNEKDFEDIKDELTNGYLSPNNTQPSLLIFFIVSGIFVGLASMVVFSSDTVIGWDGLSTFWRSVFIVETIIFSIQLLLIIFVRTINNTSQFILLVAYFIVTTKLPLDFFFAISMFFIDWEIYEKVKYLLLVIILFGFVIFFIALLVIIKRIKGESLKLFSNTKKQATFGAFSVLFPLTLFGGYIFRNNLLSGDMEGIAVVLIATIVYYLMMVLAVFPVLGIYCFIKYPSFRIEANRKK